jgi:hypothetical protein
MSRKTYEELKSGGALAVLSGDDGRANDLNGLVAGTVAAGHVVVYYNSIKW